MQTLRDYWRRAFGPSKRELQDQIAHLEGLSQRFQRRGQAVPSGVSMQYGEFQYDTNSKLEGAEKYEIYERMETDPHIKSVLLDKALPLMNAEWEIKPASDKAKDKDIAEFVGANLLRQPSEKYGREYWIQTSWKAQRLPEILSMLPVGYALFVSSWRRHGTRVVYDRLQWIEPETIDGTKPWEIDEADNILAVNRKYTSPNDNFVFDERIDASRLKLYVWDLKGARFEGRAFIRSMYGAWLRKEFILRQSAIWAQKVGAPVPVGHYPEGWDQTSISRFKRLLQALRGQSPAEAFGMFKRPASGEKAEIEYIGAEAGEVDRMRGLIRGENEEIHHGGRDSSSMLGETQTGSRALGDSKGRRENAMTNAIGHIVCEWENHGVANLSGVIEELVDRNFSANAYPELVCTKIDPYENFEATVKAWEAGIIPKVADARRQIVEGTLGLNLDDEDYDIEVPPPLVPGQPPGATTPPDSGGPPSPAQDGEEGSTAQAAALTSLDDFRKRIEPMLRPVQEGRPRNGGRFPESVGGGGGGTGRGTRGVSGGRARHSQRTAADAG